MHAAGALFKTPGNTFSRACRDLSIDTDVDIQSIEQLDLLPDLVQTTAGELE